MIQLCTESKYTHSEQARYANFPKKNIIKPWKIMCISAVHFLIILLANISLYLTYSIYQKGPDHMFVCWFSPVSHH